MLGVDGGVERISSDILMMVLDSQSPHVSKGYDYIGYVINKMHMGLKAMRKKEPTPKFMHYSLLMHLILYYNYNMMDL